MSSLSPSPQDAAIEVLKRRRARRKLEDFTSYTMMDYESTWHTRLTSDYLDRFARGEIKRLMIHEPPRHGKTELSGRRLPAFMLGQNPDEEIIACSYSADLASRSNRDVQRIIDSDSYRRVFPETRLQDKGRGGNYVRNNDIFEVVDRRGSYRSAGIGGGIVGMGFSRGLIDDFCKNREEADSPTVRESVWEWYTSTFYTRRAKDAGILITATRWNEDDLCGRLLKLAEEDPKADQWTVLTLPAICEKAGALGDPRQVGEALWPSRFSVEELEKTRAMSAYEWSAQYQQHPRPEGGTEWPAEFFGTQMRFDDWPDVAWMVKVMALDPSKGSKDKTGDYSAWCMLGVDTEKRLWVDADLCNVRAVEGATGSIISDGLRLMRQFGPSATVVETNGFQHMVAAALQRAMLQAGMLGANLFGICNTEPKETRIRTLGTYLAQKRLFIRRSKGGNLLYGQLRDFPVAEYRDGPDSLKLAEVLADFMLTGNGEGVGRPMLLVA